MAVGACHIGRVCMHVDPEAKQKEKLSGGSEIIEIYTRVTREEATVHIHSEKQD